ncbi:MAG: TetR/AcrR family transcriptional regulator [Polyangiaceae bacterium]|nr:TetR/AcrR family transcriptional regulator [Polyangiaceae bacterium]
MSKPKAPSESPAALLDLDPAGSDDAPESGRVVPLHGRSKSVPPPTRHRRSFSQQRAHDTYTSLIRAAAIVFARMGFDSAQTTDIAQEAGVSVGTFYRYFADKRQAFIEMITEHLEDAYERILANLSPEVFAAERDRQAAVDLVLDVLFEHTAEHPELHRVFLGMSLRDIDVARIRAEFESRGRTVIAALVREVVPQSHVPDPVAAAEVIQIAAQEIAVFTVGGRGVKSEARAEALREALGSMIFRYLFADAPATN